MAGLGDAIHARALIRHWLDEGFDHIGLKTSQPEIFWDFRADGRVRCFPLGTPLRTQKKNERVAEYDQKWGITDPESRVVWYRPRQIERVGSYLQAMAEYAGAIGAHDITLPIHPEWAERATQLVGAWGTDKPLLIYRPACRRKEWDNPARNPDPAVIPAILREIADRFYVVSVADLVPGVEWLDAKEVHADRMFHAGELHFTTIAALMARPGSVVLAPPSFAVCMGRAVGAPTIGVYGGHELSAWLSYGTPYRDRWLTVDPISPCGCFNRHHHCDKRVDLYKALADVTAFVDKFTAVLA